MINAITLTYFDEDNPSIDDRLQRLLKLVRQSDNIDKIILVDNSRKKNNWLEETCTTYSIKYVWPQGYNLYYVGSIREALQNIVGNTCVYFSSTKTVINKLNWTEELITLLNARTVLVGSIEPCNTSIVTPNKVADKHVQGGLFGFSKEFYLSATKYCKFPQAYSDVWLSHVALKNKLLLKSTKTICSVNDRTLPDPEKYRAVHHGKAITG